MNIVVFISLSLKLKNCFTLPLYQRAFTLPYLVNTGGENVKFEIHEFKVASISQGFNVSKENVPGYQYILFTNHAYTVKPV